MSTETDKKKDGGMEKRAVVNTPAEKVAHDKATKAAEAKKHAGKK